MTDRRWRGAIRTASGEYLPGDVLRLRALAGSWLVDLATSEWNHEDGRTERLASPDREMAALELLYASVPYFLPASAASASWSANHRICPCSPTCACPIQPWAVFFGEAFEVPAPLVGGEQRLANQRTTSTTIPDLLMGEESDPEQAPEHIRFATLAAYRQQALVLTVATLDPSRHDEARAVAREVATSIKVLEVEAQPA